MKKFSDILEKLAYTHSRSIVFDDFLQMAVCALSLGTQEELYFQTIKKYEATDLQKFAEAFALLVAEMDNDGEGLRDCLGDYFQEYISGGHNGQFFTPEAICEMMAKITIPESLETGKTVADCACGSGRTLLAAAKVNRNLKFYAADVSLTCCLMTLINLCLNNLEGVVNWMDSLSLKMWGQWVIEKNCLGVCGIYKIEIVQPVIIDIKPPDERKPKTDSTQLLLDFVA